jgi:eukaryotic-like serine/threonine-protein kinase
MVRLDGRAALHVGRYLLHDEIASGGMGTVHLGRQQGGAGFFRIVAIKRLNPLLARQPEFLRMFLDEARLAGRVRHPNVVPTSDVVESDGEVLLVMEYVHGEPLSRLMRLTLERGQLPSPGIASAVLSGVLYGLHAAHEATDERGEPLGVVHRDVSPQNVLVGADGVARLVDFGVAKATGRLQTTSEGQIKGKLSYMPPEQIQGQMVDRRADVYSAGVVLWEMLTGERLFMGENQGNTMQRVLLGDAPPPSRKVAGLPVAIDDVVLRALSREPSDRFSSAREMCSALLEACPPAPPHVVGEWVEACAHESLAARAARVSELETSTRSEVRSTREPLAMKGDVAGSQVSSISVSGELQGSRPRRAAPYVVAAGVTMAIAVAALVGRPWWRSGDATGAPPETTPTASVAPTPRAASAPMPPPTSSALDVGADASVPSAAPSPSPSPRSTPRPRVAPPAPASPPADCNPPYVRSPDGHKVWKRECFGRGQ